MYSANLDPIRLARVVYESGVIDKNIIKRIEYASQLRRLGRADLSLQLLSISPLYGDAKIAYLTEKLNCCIELGYNIDAVEILNEIKNNNAMNLELYLTEYLILSTDIEGSIPDTLYQNIAYSIKSSTEAKYLISKLNFNKISIEYTRHFIFNLFRASKWMLCVFLMKLIYSKISIILSKCFTYSFKGILFLIFRQKIYFSTLGNFTRLADIVDRLDPLLRRLSSLNSGKSFKLLTIYFGGYPNQALMKLYGSHVLFFRATNRLSRKFSSMLVSLIDKSGKIIISTTDYRKNNCAFLTEPPVIHFSPKKVNSIVKDLINIGINPDRPFICFGTRDMAYYEFYSNLSGQSLSTHRRSRTFHRCPPLSSYISFAKYWAERGYQIIRMGLKTSEQLPRDINPLIIDYAWKGRSDDLDVYLFSNCHFLVAGDTGLFSGAAAFDKPSVVSDLFLIRNTIYSSCKKTPNIFVPKLILDKRNGRYLTFREQIHMNHFFSYYEDCVNNDYEIIHNSDCDIIAASNELLERMNGVYFPTSDEIRLHRKFMSIYPPGYFGFNSTGSISSDFLRKYSYLLE